LWGSGRQKPRNRFFSDDGSYEGMKAHDQRPSPDHKARQGTAKLDDVLRTARGVLLCASAALVLIIGVATSASALPEIRIHDRNRVPACVTPERLQHFLETRNRQLPDRFKRIAAYYKLHGEKLRVRWDYAFYQMLIETNYLSYRTGSGKWGDVKPHQNNFAGIGATGGGAPGDRYPDVSTGVLAQIQHLIAYSGEAVPNPVAPRTREVQDKVVELSRALRRPVTYRDLAGRWAADRKYGTSIESIADRFRAAYCDGASEQQIAAAEPRPAARPQARVAVAESAPRSASARALPRGRAMPADEELVVNDDGDDATPARDVGEIPRAPAPPTRTATTAVAFNAPPPPAPDRYAGRGSAQPRVCKVWTASYGGQRNVLIRTIVGEEMHVTALQVLDGREDELASTFIQTHAAGGTRIDGAFPNREAALVRAFDICPHAARLQR
jgi:hypothetical protein